MSSIQLEISLHQLEEAIRRLSPMLRVKLVEDLEKDTWPDRFNALLKKIDQKASEHPVSEKEIDEACYAVRHKRHAHSCSRH